MTFIIFTDKYKEGQIFKKFNQIKFGERVHAFVVSQQLESFPLLKEHTSFPIGLNDIPLIIINDIDISLRENIKILIDDINEQLSEVYILFHKNGSCKQQREFIKTRFDSVQFYSIKDSHIAGSIYFDHMVKLAEAFDANDTDSWNQQMIRLKKLFINQYIKDWKDALCNTKMVKKQINTELPQILINRIMKTEDWEEYVAAIKDLDENHPDFDIHLEDTNAKFFNR